LLKSEVVKHLVEFFDPDIFEVSLAVKPKNRHRFLAVKAEGGKAPMNAKQLQEELDKVGIKLDLSKFKQAASDAPQDLEGLITQLKAAETPDDAGGEDAKKQTVSESMKSHILAVVQFLGTLVGIKGDEASPVVDGSSVPEPKAAGEPVPDPAIAELRKSLAAQETAIKEANDRAAKVQAELDLAKREAAVKEMCDDLSVQGVLTPAQRSNAEVLLDELFANDKTLAIKSTDAEGKEVEEKTSLVDLLATLLKAQGELLPTGRRALAYKGEENPDEFSDAACDKAGTEIAALVSEDESKTK